MPCDNGQSWPDQSGGLCKQGRNEKLNAFQTIPNAEVSHITQQNTFAKRMADMYTEYLYLCDSSGKQNEQV